MLSTSNKPGAVIAAECRLTWDAQEQARFIDIPVPPPEKGGIFDRLTTKGESRRRESTRMISELEEALEQHYGNLLRPWIKFLMEVETGELVEELMQRFLKKVGNPTGLDDRIAKKFAIVYAAGWIAVNAGQLSWPTSLPMNAVYKLYMRAKRERLRPADGLQAGLEKLAKALKDPDQVRKAKPGARLKIARGQNLLGIHYGNKARTLIGLRREGISAVVGPHMLQPVVRWLADNGALAGGHGNKAAQQLPVTLCVGNTEIEKPRFLIADPKALTKCLDSAGA